jgi:hypothetical protein
VELASPASYPGEIMSSRFELSVYSEKEDSVGSRLLNKAHALGSRSSAGRGDSIYRDISEGFPQHQIAFCE